MKRILVTGATGNIGREVIHYLCELDQASEIIAAVRNVETAKKKFPSVQNLSYRPFDFENEELFDTAFENVDILFLLRPPPISQVEAVFRPLLLSAKENGIDKVVFLSVQGAEKSTVIPHNKIERLIKSLGFRYIFVRPSYFMQNLTITLLPEILKNQTITLPSAQAKFNWIDVKNIGEATAVLIKSFEEHHNNAYIITGEENKHFQEVADLMSKVTGVDITFKSKNPLSFYFRKRKEGITHGFALVMTMLHFLPRIQGEPEITDDFYRITGKKPTSLAEFLERVKDEIKPSSK
jgi:uncharacterized protein YbjT (DUF2867 family)